MGYEALINAINTRFGTQVEDVLSIPVAYDNMPFDNPPADSEWIRFTILTGHARVAEYGLTNRYRRVGVFKAIVHTPVETGLQTAAQHADVIVTAFRAVTADGVRYKDPDVKQEGRSGNWWRVTVTCPFYSDEFA